MGLNAAERAFREWGMSVTHIAHRESFLAGRASVIEHPLDAAEQRKITPWTRTYGTPGGMFTAAVVAITQHEKAMLCGPASIAMSTSTRRAMVREWFPDHDPGDWQEGELVAGVPIVINDLLPFGRFLTTDADR